MDRSAHAVWHGGLKDGKGTLSTQSGTLKDTQYSFASRFETGTGTNPEELIAAAHAGCFTMALSAQLTDAGLVPDTLETTAAVTLEKTEDGPTVTKIHLQTKAKVPGAEKEKVRRARQESQGRLPDLPPPEGRRNHARRAARLETILTRTSLRTTTKASSVRTPSLCTLRPGSALLSPVCES